jgi:hypothetical protein
MADLGKQAPNDVLAAFVKYEFDERPVAELVEDAEAVDLDQPIDQLNAGAEPASKISANRRGNLGQVGLENTEGRVRQPVCQLTVVRKEEQAFGIRVEPAHVEEPHRPVGHEVGYRRPASRILHRADHATGLIEGKVGEPRRRRNSLSVDPDDRVKRVDAETLSGDQPPVDFDASLSDQVLTRPPTAHSRLCQNLLQANRVVAFLGQD